MELYRIYFVCVSALKLAILLIVLSGPPPHRLRILSLMACSAPRTGLCPSGKGGRVGCRWSLSEAVDSEALLPVGFRVRGEWRGGQAISSYLFYIIHACPTLCSSHWARWRSFTC